MFPYITLLLVALVFLGVCRFFFYVTPKKRRAPYVPRYTSTRERATTRSLKTREHLLPVEEPNLEETIVMAPVTAIAAEATKEIPRVINQDIEKESSVNELEETRVVDREELRQIRDTQQVPQPQTTSTISQTESAEEKWLPPTDADSVSRRHLRHFLVRYATVTPELAADAEKITERAFAKLGDLPNKEVQDIMSHIMVQEALVNAQRVYVMLPDDVILEMVTNAFVQVALGERDHTMTLLAYDALDAMTHMEHGHYHILALLLLFHYSRNTNNISTAAFRRYAKKYVEPLLADLPAEYSYYQQLEYLQTVTMSGRDALLGEILRDSYPYFFAYRGFTEKELTDLLQEERLRAEFVVKSIYGDYYKLAVADFSALPEFFRRAEVEDEEKRHALTKLMQSRPVSYDRREGHKVLQATSPTLAQLADIWDSSMMRRCAPTLLGMYIGRAYIKEVIGEEFDLSRWI